MNRLKLKYDHVHVMTEVQKPQSELNHGSGSFGRFFFGGGAYLSQFSHDIVNF